ncbi:MAG TPA: YfhO family protein [Chloroflexota bacterium]|nr:YfhO family protein [Chloroflexota bacterium]
MTRRCWPAEAAGVAVIAGVTLLFFSPLLAGQTFSAVGAQMYAQFPWAALAPTNVEITAGHGYPQPGDASTLYPFSVFSTRALHAGQLPLWLPLGFGGFPAAELGMHGFLYPPRLLAMLLLDPIRQHDLTLLGHVLIAGLGMYALLRSWGANSVGATLGALVWQLNGQTASWLVEEDVVIAAAWLPLALLSASLAVRRQSPRWALATGAAEGMALLGGSPSYVLAGTLVLGSWYGFSSAAAARRLPNRRWLSPIALPLCSALVAAALSSALWLPALRVLTDPARQPVALAPQAPPAFQWIEIVRGLVAPEARSGPASTELAYRSFAFVGHPALVLAVAGLFRRSAGVVLAAAVGLVGLAGAVVANPLLNRIVPAASLATFDIHASLYLVCFALAILAAFGLTELVQRLGETRRPSFQIFWRAALVAEVWQLVTFGWMVNPLQPADAAWLYPETPFIGRLLDLQADRRVLPIHPVFGGNVAAAFGVRSGPGLESSQTTEVAPLWALLGPLGSRRAEASQAPRPSSLYEELPLALLDKLSIGLLATPPGVTPLDEKGADPIADGRLRLVYRGADGWIYQNPNALPRAFMVPRVVLVSDSSAALRLMGDPNFGPSEAAIVSGPLPAAQAVLLNDIPRVDLLTASPNPVPADATVATISWTTPDGSIGQVWVTQDDGPEALFADGVSGSLATPPLAFGSSYEFRLYSGRERAILLDSATVTREAPDNPAALVEARRVSATPNPVPADSSATTVEWKTPDGSVAQIWVAKDDEPEELFSGGAGGSKVAPWIEPGARYEFRLYAGEEHTTVLDSVTVKREMLSVAPNPISVDSTDTTVSWSTPDGSVGQVWVSQDGRPEELFGQDSSGSQVAPWISPSSRYEFRLYAGTDRAALLDTVTVMQAQPTVEAKPEPAPLSSVHLRATPNPVPVDSSLTTISWSTPDGSVGQVWVSEDGKPETLFAQGADGKQAAPWIGPSSIYEFRLYAGRDRATLLDTIAVMRVAASAAPGLTTPGMKVAPDPLPAGSGPVSVAWSTAAEAVGQVWVSQDGRPEVLFAEGRSGSQAAAWVSAGVTYDFRLYAGRERATLLDDVTVERGRATIRAPITSPPLMARAAWREAGEARAAIVRDDLNEVEIEVDAPKAGLMVLNDTWFPGWRVFVNGTEHQVLRVNYGFRGVILPEGPQRVIFEYRPRAFLLGLAITLVTFVALTVLGASMGARARRGAYVHRRLTPARAQEPPSALPVDAHLMPSKDWIADNGGVPTGAGREGVFLGRTGSRRQFTAALCVLASVAGLFFLPLLRGDTFVDAATRQNTLYPWAVGGITQPPVVHYDLTDTFYPWQVFVNRALRSGEVPLWNPYSFTGQPFFGNGQNGVLYPPRALLSLTVPAERVHDLMLVSHMLIGGITMYLLLASAGLRLPAALFGAVAWMVNSFMLTWMALDHFVVIEAWLPLAVLLLHRAIVHHSWTASLSLGIVLALIYLGGNLLFVAITFATLGGYADYLLVIRWRRLYRSEAGLARGKVLPDILITTVPFLLMGGLIAVQFLPTLDTVRSMGRAALPYDQLISFRLIAWEPLYFFLGLPRWDAQEVTDPYHRLLFLGTATAYLALIGVFVRRHPLVGYARWLGLVVLLVVLGTPVAWLAYVLLPGFNAFKPLGRALFLFNFAVAILAAFGLDFILRLRPLGRPATRQRLAWWGPAVAVVLGLLVVVQMYSFARAVVPHYPDARENLYPETPLLESLGRGEQTRILPIDPFFFGSIPMVYGLESAGGYDSLLPDRITNFWRVVQGVEPERVFREARIYAFQIQFAAESVRLDLLPRLGVTDVLAPPRVYYTGRSHPDEQPDLSFSRASNLSLVYDGPDGRIYHVADPLPRAYLVADCERADGPLAALRRFSDPAFEPRASVVIEAAALDDGAACGMGAPTTPREPVGKASIVSRSLNAETVRLEASRTGWLVVNESWDTGWTALLDGRPASLLPGNYAFRTLQVPAGEHTVELRYQPAGFWRGVSVSALTLGALLAICLAWAARRVRVKSAR